MTEESKNDLVELFIVGLVLDPTSQAPVVVLRDENNILNLPIWIGIAEATAIASAIKQIEMTRPLTHDLMVTALSEVGISISKVVITDLKESTYYAELVLTQGDRVIIIDCRPSDAIALAIRAEAQIYASRQVIELARQAVRSKLPPQEDSPPENEAKELQNFQDIDKTKWEEILDKLDAEDFKYKM